MELTTLHDRLFDAIRAADAVVLMPDVVGAWGTYRRLTGQRPAGTTVWTRPVTTS